MTERPKRLPSILALMSALNIFDDISEPSGRALTVASSKQRSAHRVAHDKRAARKARNRRRAREAHRG
jgi:hypothetical protein